MKSKIINIKAIAIILTVISTVFSFALSSRTVRAAELEGYTTVDWSWNRDIESLDNNSVIIGGNIAFWRYVNGNDPASGAIWKSAFGDELTDDEVMQIWSGDFGEKYISASVDIDDIPDENIRNYIYNHIEEGVPELKLKFDIDADVGGKTNSDKAKNLFNGDVGYRIYRDNNGSDRIELKFSPKFYLVDGNIKDEVNQLPHMPYKPLPRARYPYSSVIFSMWGFEGGSNDHYGALEVVEGDDPKYIYGQSFGYGDILEKGKIPNNMVYPNFEAGQINPEGNWAGIIEADTLDSNLIRIGQQYKSNGDLWYYSYGGAVGYNFKFPFKVSLAVDEHATVTRRFINSTTGELIFTDTETMPFKDNDSISKTYVFADKSRKAIIDNTESEYIYERYEVKNGSNNENLGKGEELHADVFLTRNSPFKTLDIYVRPNTPIETPKPDDNNTPSDEIETMPIDPSICDSDTSTITWQEQISHRVTDADGRSHTCYHTYTYQAKLKIDRITLSPDPIKSGYGLEAEIKTSVSYEQIDAEKSRSCSRSLGSRTPSEKPIPPTKVTARLGWTSQTFGGIFIQGSMVDMDRTSHSNTSSTFSAPYNDVTNASKLYTDLWLSGTKEEPRKHKIAFDIYGGGVDGTEWCTTVEKIFTINGDMYEDAYTVEGF